MKGTLRAGAVSMKPVVAAGAALLAFVVLAVAFDAQWCVGMARRAVYGPPPAPVSMSLTVTPDGAVTVNGERVQGGMATKTQVTDAAQTVSGVISLTNLDQPLLGKTPVGVCSVTGGGVEVGFGDITESGWAGANPQPDPPAGTAAVFVRRIDTDPDDPLYGSCHDFVYIPTGGPYTVSAAYSIRTTGARVHRERTSSPGTGRDNSPVYARETSATDTWHDLDPPLSWVASFGSLSSSGTQYDFGGTWFPRSITQLGGIALSWGMNTANSGLTFATITVDWSAVALDFSGMSKTFATGYKLVGSGSGVSMTTTSTAYGDPNEMSVTVGRPYLKDFSPFAVVDLAGDLLPDLLIDGGFVADPRYPWTADCPVVPPA